MKLKIISDGTNTGTKLIDEETGQMVHGISKITWTADAEELLTKTCIEFFNIPIEFTSDARVEVLGFDKEPDSNFEKKVKVLTEEFDSIAITTSQIKVFDAETNQPMGCVLKAEWEATPEVIRAKVIKINK